MVKFSTSISNAIFRLINSPSFKGDNLTNLLKVLICDEKPRLIARIGSCELQFLFWKKYYPLSKIIEKRTLRNIGRNAGYFSQGGDNDSRFYHLYVDNFTEIDSLLSWRIEEFFFKRNFQDIVKLDKTDFDLFFTKTNPWTQYLADKKVLVVSPFAETITKQYNERRSLLFTNPKTLPKFKTITTVKAVQSIAGNKSGFSTWFDALNWMEKQIDKCDYDIALLGCGSYGFPLAAYIKKKGKKAIYMGGVTQFLFGIRGKRYDDSPIYRKYINEYFVYPPVSDRPQNADIVEGGCYW
jgi:hypothetical protein